MGHGASAPAGVVTPEAVRLEFEAAGIGSRSIALALDLAVQLGAVFALLFAGSLAIDGTGVGLPEWAGVTLVLLLVFAVFWGYPVALETLWRGRTLGKAAMGLRVVTQEGAPVRFRHAAIRAALALVDFYMTSGAAAVISALVTREHQRLGDLVAGTLVLRERTGAPRPEAVTFAVPPGDEAYAATIDPSGLSTDDYATVRSFLLRAPDLAADVRADLAWRLAQPLAAKLGHHPPEDVHPERFLRCLAARYQQRGSGGSPGARSPGRPGAGPGVAPGTARPPGPGTARSPGPDGDSAPGTPSAGAPSPPHREGATSSGRAGGFAPPG